MVSRGVTLLAVVVVVVAVVGEANGCQYWCKKPSGARYCCGVAGKRYADPGPDKPGQCPPIRGSCPEFVRISPEVCPHDQACPGAQKCCFDTCLDHHVCKSIPPPYVVG